ncbi:hypothetical protein ACFQ4C_20775 [Larkinella insperata]|uniref:N-acetyltransferase domain-containing protein n=1 Tax=Larkinella insperata TaxID=332158 RepID=A0ABW3QA36_9BACT
MRGHKTANTLVELAAHNNAEWCDIVCKANGAPGHFDNSLWHSVHEVPRYYPNIVSLNPNCSLEKIHPLLQQIPGKISIKDSYNALDLAVLGFTKLFDAQWLLAPEPGNPPLDYQLITNVPELIQWEIAWGSGAVSGIFKQEILSNESVRFIAIYQKDQLVAGAVAHKSEGVIGLSNVFILSHDPKNCWLTCLAAAQTLDDNLPVVAYERGDVLAFVQSIGFNALGPLSVWIKT